MTPSAPMNTLLCFGDSNTWGYDPAGTAASTYPVRHPPHVRWTGVLARELGAGWRVIEEGQNGRTTVHEDPMAVASRNGRHHLPVCLESHKPIDVVVLMLGSNDLKTMFNLPPGDIAAGASLLVKTILQSDAGPGAKAPRVLLICPPAIGDLSRLPELNAKLAGGREKSLALPGFYQTVANLHGVNFLNSQDHVVPSPVDGIHLEAGDHEALGKAVAKAVSQMSA